MTFLTACGRQDEDPNIRIGRAISIMSALHYSLLWNENCQKKRKALNLRNSLCPFSPTVLLYGHENLVTTERVQSQVQASKMRFLRKINRVTLLTRCTSLELRKSQEPLLLQMERSQLRWFGHVSRMPTKKLPRQALLAKVNGKKTVGRPRTTADESKLHWGSWVELRGTSLYRND